MIYIGLDQSSKVVGYAVMNETELLDYGVYKVPQSKDLMNRIRLILKFLDGLIQKYPIDEVIVGLEDTQESKMNTKTFQLLTKVLGVIEHHLFCQDIPYKVCHVSSWREHAGVKGKRRENKKQHAIDIVKKRLDIEDIAEDAAEAVLITDYLRSQQDKWT